MGKNSLLVSVRFPCSHLSPLSLAARSLTEGTISNDELPTAPPTGVYGCALCMPLVGELAGTSDPSEMGTSAGSLARVRRRGGSGTRDLPLSLRSSSARLVLALILLLTLGLWERPRCIWWPTGMHMPTIKSSPIGRRRFPLPSSTMPLGLSGAVLKPRPFRVMDSER